jgi:hypothetical protein
MNTNALAREYGKLTPLERVSALMAAESRGDQIEGRRLRDSWRPRDIEQVRIVPDYLWLQLKLHILAHVYVTEQLDALANYWLARAELEALAEKGVDPAPVLLAAQSSAYMFICNAEAWRQFCTELAIDPDQLTAGSYGGLLLEICEETMQKSAPTREALAALLQGQGKDGSKLTTSDALLDRWRNLSGRLSASASGVDAV